MASGYINIAHLYRRMPALTDTNGDHLISVSDLRTAIAMAAAETGGVVEVVRCEGEWIPHRFDKNGRPISWYCSNCKGIGDHSSYCSHCGAKMKGGA